MLSRTHFRRLGLAAAVLSSLPILLFVYQPPWRLGGIGLALGAIGYTVSPAILFAVLAGWVRRNW